MPLVQDHKRAYEGDVGPNTGGMGSYSQEDHLLPFVTAKDRDAALDIMRRTVEAMAEEGCPYRGVLYGQFMNTRDGPKVIEFNARFGDPEAMNVLSIISSSFTNICEGIADGNLSPSKVVFQNKATVCKYVVPQRLRHRADGRQEIKVDEKAIAREGARSFFAMVNEEDGRILTDLLPGGGRGWHRRYHRGGRTGLREGAVPCDRETRSSSATTSAGRKCCARGSSTCSQVRR